MTSEEMETVDLCVAHEKRYTQFCETCMRFLCPQCVDATEKREQEDGHGHMHRHRLRGVEHVRDYIGEKLAAIERCLQARQAELQSHQLSPYSSTTMHQADKKDVDKDEEDDVDDDDDEGEGAEDAVHTLMRLYRLADEILESEKRQALQPRGAGLESALEVSASTSACASASVSTVKGNKNVFRICEC